MADEPAFTLRPFDKPISKKKEKQELEYILARNKSRENIYGQPKWIYNTNNWPDQRYNWPEQSDYVKSLIIDGYNKQRVAMGHEPVPNVYRKEWARPTADTITPPTPGKEKIYNNPLFPGDEKQKFPYNPNMQGSADKRIRFPGDIDKWRLGLIEKSFAFPRGELTQQDRDLIRNFKTFLKSNKGQEVIDNAKKSDPVAGTSGLKRKAEDQLEEPPTKSTPSTTTSTTSSPTTIGVPKNTTEVDMVNSAPGTAMDQAGPSAKRPASEMAQDEVGGTGKGSAGGFDSTTGPSTQIARPFTSIHGGEFVFTKTIKILSYGAAPKILAVSGATGYVCLTTCLLEIPWDRLFMYMNPGEFAALPKGSFAKSAHMTVTQWNPRIAFETGATDSLLATLNQNKLGRYAVGLNKNKYIRGANRKLTFQTGSEPMIPSAAAVPTYSGYPKVFYGVPQNDTDFNNYVPSQPTGTPVAGNTYWTTYSYNTSKASTTGQNPGWPDMTKYVTEYDMNLCTGKKVINMDYKFNYCPLTPQLPTVDYLSTEVSYYAPQPKIARMETNISITNTGSSQQSTVEIAPKATYVDGTPPIVEVQTNNDISASKYTGPANLYDLIDKSHLHGDNTRCAGFSRSIMPSVHVGVSPIPRINTAIQGGQINSWTDVQAMWECNMTLVTGYHMAHSSTHYPAMHDIIDNQKMGIDEVPGIKYTNPVVLGTWCADL